MKHLNNFFEIWFLALKDKFSDIHTPCRTIFGCFVLKFDGQRDIPRSAQFVSKS